MRGLGPTRYLMRASIADHEGKGRGSALSVSARRSKGPNGFGPASRFITDTRNVQICIMLIRECSALCPLLK